MVKSSATAIAVGCGLLLALGCRASVSANASTGGKDEVEDFDKPLSGATAPVSEDELGELALLGARHDLTLAESAATKPVCQCLAIALGSPTDSSFKWESVIPRIDPASQLVVALGSKGVACGEKVPEGTLGASYWGYKQDGDNVIIVVENAREGRPITTGAIIPRPFNQGRIYVAPRSKNVPYGANPNGSKELCRIEVPPERAATSMDGT